MLNVTSLTADAQKALKYYLQGDDKKAEQLGVFDYYDKEFLEQSILQMSQIKSTNPDMFKRLKLEGADFQKAFAFLWESCNADGEFLKPKNSSHKEKALDFTFNSQKEVSALIALLPEEDAQLVNKLFMQSVHESMAEMTDLVDLASSGRNKLVKGQAVGQTAKADLVYATFNHGINRNNDPHLHAHVIVFNLVQRRSDGKLLNMNRRELMRSGDNYRDIIGNIQRNRFIELLKQEFAFEVDNSRHTFKIKGLSEELVHTWSSRANEIEKELEQEGLSGSKAKNKVAMSSRKDKAKVLPLPEQRAIWREEAKAEQNLDELSKVFRRLEPREKQKSYKADSFDVQDIYERATGFQAYFTERDLIKATLREIEPYGLSKHERNKLMKQVLQLVQDEELQKTKLAESQSIVYLGEVNDKAVFSTKEMLDLEQQINGFAENIINRSNLSIDEELLEKHIAICEKENGFPYTAEQKANMRHIALSHDFAMVQGQAGAGKTTLLEPIVDAWRERGYHVHGIAISGKVSAAMNELDLESNTIDALLMKIEKEQLKATDVIVVDESAMVGSRHMVKLLKAVELAGAKLTLVGDIRQLQPVSAGNPSKTLQKAYTASQLNEVYRHKKSFGKIVNDAIAKEDGNLAIQTLLKENRINITHDVLDMRKNMSNKFFEHFELGNTNSSVMIASTNNSVNELNNLARNKLIAEGKLDPVANGRIKLLAKNGQEETLEFKEFTVGDHVVFLKNDKKREDAIFNGHIGHVISLSPANNTMTIQLQNGSERTIGYKEYQYINHAYAITTHKSQGATFDNVQAEWGSFQDQHSSYVALTRQKNELDVFVSEQQIHQYKAFNPINDKEFLTATSIFNKLDKESQIDALDSGYSQDMSLSVYEDFVINFGSESQKQAILVSNTEQALERMATQTSTANMKENATDILIQNAVTAQAQNGENQEMRVSLKEIQRFVKNADIVNTKTDKAEMKIEKAQKQTQSIGITQTAEKLKEKADSLQMVMAGTIDRIKEVKEEVSQSVKNMLDSAKSSITSLFKKPEQKMELSRGGKLVDAQRDCVTRFIETAHELDDSTKEAKIAELAKADANQLRTEFNIAYDALKEVYGESVELNQNEFGISRMENFELLMQKHESLIQEQVKVREQEDFGVEIEGYQEEDRIEELEEQALEEQALEELEEQSRQENYEESDGLGGQKL